MRSDIPPALLEHLRQDSSTPALLWAIERRDGLFIRGTEHDLDIVIPSVGSPQDELAGLYLANASITASDITSNTDMSVSNTEAEGTIQPPPYTEITDITVRDIEGGQLDMAPVYVMVCNWRDPSMGYGILRTAHLGEISRDSDGRYRTEVRGLAQLLSQSILQTYGERCNVVRFGDARCKFPVATVTITVTVTSVDSRRRFHVSGITTQPEQFFGGGVLRGLTGNNEDIEREVKRDNRGGVQGFIDLWAEMPLEVEVGDTFALEPGCDRTLPTCRDRWDNVVNIKAHGALIPGVLELLKGPT